MKEWGLSPLPGGMQAEGSAECLSQAEFPYRNPFISFIPPWKDFLGTGRSYQAVLGSSSFLFKTQKGSQGTAGMCPALHCDTSSEQRWCLRALLPWAPFVLSCQDLPQPGQLLSTREGLWKLKG